MNRLLFNIVDVGVRHPDSVKRLYGRGNISYSFMEEPDEETWDMVQSWEPDFVSVPEDRTPLQTIIDVFGADKFDVVFNFYAHEVIDPMGDLLDQIKYENIAYRYLMDIYYFWDSRNYISERPIYPCTEPRGFPLLGDGVYNLVSFMSGDHLIPEYVPNLPSFSLTVGRVMNFKMLHEKDEATRIPQTREWTMGGLP